MMPPGGRGDPRASDRHPDPPRPRPAALVRDARRRLMLPRDPSKPCRSDATERRMVAQTRHAVDHHRRVPASLIQQRAALRTVAQAAWIEARREERLLDFRAVSRKDRRARPPICGLHRLERASLRRHGVDLRAGRDGREPQALVRNAAGRIAADSRRRARPRQAAFGFSVPRLSRRRSSAPSASAWRDTRI